MGYIPVWFSGKSLTYQDALNLVYDEKKIVKIEYDLKKYFWGKKQKHREIKKKQRNLSDGDGVDEGSGAFELNRRAVPSQILMRP